MKTFVHTLNTWTMSVTIGSLSLLFYTAFLGPDPDSQILFDPLWITMLSVVFVVALPAFFLSWILLVLIVESALTVNLKIIAWYTSVLFATLLNVAIVIFFDSGGRFSLHSIGEFWPVLIVVYIVVTFRLRQFLKLVITISQKETASNDNTQLEQII